MTDPDHPTLHALWGYCTSCHRIFEWRCLRPIVTPQDRMLMLCGVCDFKMQPRESVSCEGVNE